VGWRWWIRGVPRLQAARGFDRGRGLGLWIYMAGGAGLGRASTMAMVGLSGWRGAKLATKNMEGLLGCGVEVIVDRRD
jgi:hypothetical protein